jgi:hypothetical protein
VYGEVPPAAALAVMLPVGAHALEPIVDAIEMETPVGCVTIADTLAVHPLLSVAVMVYVPPLRLEAVRLVPPDGVQL